MIQVRDAKGRFAKVESNGSVRVLNTELLYKMINLNATLKSRTELLQKGLDPRRDINDECGYPDTVDLRSREYKELYDRESIAARVVEVLPQESWKINPSVVETEDKDNVTVFEQAWKDMCASISGDVGDSDAWFRDDRCNPVWELLARADKLSGIGHFGGILIGVDDVSKLARPVRKSPERRLIFLRAFDQTQMEIPEYENNKTNIRYGQPKVYNLALNTPNDAATGIGYATGLTEVHWSRVVHLADNRDSSDIWGVPRQQPVLNRLLDLRKLYGGSAEMYWKGAFMGLSLETHPELGGDVEFPSDIKEQIEEFQNGLQRYIAIAGITAKSLAPQVVDPVPHIDSQIDAICIKVGIPKRIFMGTERGKLASTQDADTWKDRVMGRRVGYVTPKIIVPFINRLIKIGILPEPEVGYRIDWNEQETIKPAERADIAVKRVSAMSQYISGDVDALIEEVDFMTRELGYSREEADEILTGRSITPKELRDAKAQAAREKVKSMKQPNTPPGSDKEDRTAS